MSSAAEAPLDVVVDVAGGTLGRKIEIRNLICMAKIQIVVCIYALQALGCKASAKLRPYAAVAVQQSGRSLT
jgi:hypothetical protein